MVRLGRQRAVQADDVGVAEQPTQLVASPREERLRAERLDEPPRLASDPARPDDADEFAVEALAEHELEREAPRLAAADQAVALGDAPEQRQHQRHGELGRRPREHVRRVRDEYPAPPRGLEVDVVHADGVVGDDLQLRPRPVEQLHVDGRRQEREDAVGAFRGV